jgi:predicted dehydrogenase
MLKMGIIGCGWAGEHHAEAILTLRKLARITAICDYDQATLNERGEAWGVESRYTDYRQLLARAEVDALSICTPHDLHAEMAIAAAEAGKHILVEKPLARTLDEADAMIDAAEKAGVVLMVAENVRFNNYYLKAKELIDDGYLGDIFLVYISRMEMARRELLDRPWFLDARRAGGGIMMSGGVHDFEAMRMLAGEVKEVFAYQAKKTFPEMQGDDTSVAVIGFEDGTAGVLMESFSANALKAHNTVEIYGSLGSLRTDIYGPHLMSLYSEKLQNLPGRARVDITVPEGDTFVAEMSHFIDCVAHGQVPTTSGAEERKPLAAVLAAYESMDVGRKITLL